MITQRVIYLEDPTFAFRVALRFVEAAIASPPTRAVLVVWILPLIGLKCNEIKNH